MGSKRSKDASEALVTRLELAKIIRVDPRTIQKWTEIGLPTAKRGRGGRASLYSVADVLAWRDTHIAPATSASGLSLADERARRERAQAELAEQTLAIRARNLLDAEEVERAWSAILSAIRAKLLAVPQAYADRLTRAIHAEGSPGCERMLVQLVDEVLAELSTPTDEARA